MTLDWQYYYILADGYCSSASTAESAIRSMMYEMVAQNQTTAVLFRRNNEHPEHPHTLMKVGASAELYELRKKEYELGHPRARRL